MYTLYHGDCLDVLKKLSNNSVDSVITDPPYGLAFMGKKWDYNVPSVEIWKETIRVLKPGGHLLSFGGTRTYHRMVINIEDAGFEIRDQIAWIYGSGFPKSHNIGNGWGTALKPAMEPIVVARKPLEDTVARNVAKYDTGAINIEECRVGINKSVPASESKHDGIDGIYSKGIGPESSNGSGFDPNVGRWPANVIHDGSDEVIEQFPLSKGQQGDVKGTEKSKTGGEGTNCYGEYNRVSSPKRNEQIGSAARFFYCAKTSKKDRDEGLSLPEKKIVTFATANGTSGKPSSISEGRNTSYRNNHPTVKPTDLMRYLCRLVTPKSGIVLDPFMGSGSTGKAAILEKFNFIGIELEEDYVNLAAQRIDAVMLDTIEKYLE